MRKLKFGKVFKKIEHSVNKTVEHIEPLKIVEQKISEPIKIIENKITDKITNPIKKDEHKFVDKIKTLIKPVIGTSIKSINKTVQN